MNAITNLSDLQNRTGPREAQLPQVRAGFTDLQGFELMQRAAKAMAASNLVPQQFQGDIPNCMIALEMAHRIGASPLMVAQNLYVVHGKPGWSSKFLIATFNQCGRFSAIRYEWQSTSGKKDWGCRAYATEKATGERIQSAWITWSLVEAEGWNKKNGSKWTTMPEQMFMYRAAAWLVNTHAPEISMGLNTADELGDVYEAEPTPEGYVVTTETLRHEEQTAPETSPQTQGSIKIDPDVLRERLANATDIDTLDADASLIESIEDAELRVELKRVYNERRESLQ